MISPVKASPAEMSTPLPGDDIVPEAGVVIDRAMTLNAPPEEVWPWLLQMGRRTVGKTHKRALQEGTIALDRQTAAGWYLPAGWERFLPRRGRSLQHIDDSIKPLQEGDVIPDYAGFGKPVTAKVAILEPDTALVFTGNRGRTNWSWALALRQEEDERTRLQLRIRTGPIKHKKLIPWLGGAFDHLVVAGFEKGLNERLAKNNSTNQRPH